MSTAEIARRVLIVDDEPRVARIHAGFIATADGFSVCAVAGSAASALEAVAKHSPDLVLLDVHLPDGNGLDLLPRLRALHPGLEVIVITAAREQNTVAKALRGGAVGYLIKPFSQTDLVARLADFRERARLTETGSEVGQDDVNRLFGAVSPRGGDPATGAQGTDASPAGGPTSGGTVTSRQPSGRSSGLNPATLDAIRLALQRAEVDLSANEAAQAVGVSRVSARRYLEHLLESGAASVQLRYGAGRPERRYRLR